MTNDLGDQRVRTENNIAMDIRKTVCDDVEWIQVAQDGDKWRRPANAVIQFRAP